ncbi:UPF0755 protein [Saccharopolyspora lacisalsi]|uniref:Endolytic murein transglycosylase n=1 Tax=Halosaccharopolyspora lacisalsi TaxID=1000566 RepID=A0A839DR19_9PSEU|nr:endolytic transglycosylase MltG [Halosaccharopolyspora lacisalsi]MBA8823513.1 UPF0755 protein [Halosaccharopolyspora lacisalsi]
MSDDLGLFADETSEAPQRGRKEAGEERDRFRRRRRRRSVTAAAGVLVLLIIGAGVFYSASLFLSIGDYEDYEGPGTGHVVIEVKQGDTTSAIASTLAEHDVVASATAFLEAARKNEAVSGIQPGFYLMKHKMSGEAAVSHILSEEASVGRVEVRGGMRLADQVDKRGRVVEPGILTMLAKATCTGSEKDCVSGEKMQKVAAETDPADLGAPQWALGPTSKAPPGKQLEGLIMPGVYDVEPGESAKQILRSVVTKSATKMEAAGLPQLARSTPFSPYEVLTIASLVQSEGIRSDFGKVARVVYNRIETDMPLQFDSTINYPLDQPTLLTDDADRDRPGPYNTYLNEGLPPTPISAASTEAISAAEKPQSGPWVYFVKCHKDGRSCFSENMQQHKQAIRKAQERGAY